MQGTTCDASQCVCATRSAAAIFASWSGRVRALIAEGIGNGRKVNVANLNVSASLADGIVKGAPAAFDPMHAQFGHHMPECPFASSSDVVASALLC